MFYYLKYLLHLYSGSPTKLTINFKDEIKELNIPEIKELNIPEIKELNIPEIKAKLEDNIDINDKKYELAKQLKPSFDFNENKYEFAKTKLSYFVLDDIDIFVYYLKKFYQPNFEEWPKWKDKVLGYYFENIFHEKNIPELFKFVQKNINNYKKPDIKPDIKDDITKKLFNKWLNTFSTLNADSVINSFQQYNKNVYEVYYIKYIIHLFLQNKEELNNEQKRSIRIEEFKDDILRKIDNNSKYDYAKKLEPYPKWKGDRYDNVENTLKLYITLDDKKLEMFIFYLKNIYVIPSHQLNYISKNKNISQYAWENEVKEIIKIYLLHIFKKIEYGTLLKDQNENLNHENLNLLITLMDRTKLKAIGDYIKTNLNIFKNLLPKYILFEKWLTNRFTTLQFNQYIEDWKIYEILDTKYDYVRFILHVYLEGDNNDLKDSVFPENKERSRLNNLKKNIDYENVPKKYKDNLQKGFSNNNVRKEVEEYIKLFVNNRGNHPDILLFLFYVEKFVILNNDYPKWKEPMYNKIKELLNNLYEYKDIDDENDKKLVKIYVYYAFKYNNFNDNLINFKSIEEKILFKYWLQLFTRIDTPLDKDKWKKYKKYIEMFYYVKYIIHLYSENENVLTDEIKTIKDIIQNRKKEQQFFNKYFNTSEIQTELKVEINDDNNYDNAKLLKPYNGFNFKDDNEKYELVKKTLRQFLVVNEEKLEKFMFYLKVIYVNKRLYSYQWENEIKIIIQIYLLCLLKGKKFNKDRNEIFRTLDNNKYDEIGLFIQKNIGNIIKDSFFNHYFNNDFNNDFKIWLQNIFIMIPLKEKSLKEKSVVPMFKKYIDMRDKVKYVIHLFLQEKMAIDNQFKEVSFKNKRVTKYFNLPEVQANLKTEFKNKTFNLKRCKINIGGNISIIELLNTFLNVKKNELYLFELYLKNNDTYSYEWKNTLEQQIINEIVKCYNKECNKDLIKKYLKLIDNARMNTLTDKLKSKLNISSVELYTYLYSIETDKKWEDYKKFEKFSFDNLQISVKELIQNYLLHIYYGINYNEEVKIDISKNITRKLSDDEKNDTEYIINHLPAQDLIKAFTLLNV